MSHFTSAHPDTDDECEGREQSEFFEETAFQNTMDSDHDEDHDKKNMLNKRKITKDDLKHLMLSGVKVTTSRSCVLGRGSFGTVYKAEYNRTACAAKQVDHYIESRCSIPDRMKQNFLLECLQHSQLNHPNIVKMLGVFYRNDQAILPFLVMELMDYNLTQLLESSHNIIMYVKLSILQDVSRGLCYLHAQNPPIVHQALYSDNILFTKGLTAKIGDFKTGAETVSDQANLSVRRNIDSNDFLPYSRDILKYDLPLNIFSFGCIICHVITQEWPSIQHHSLPAHNSGKKLRCLTTDGLIGNWSVKKHRNYIDLIDDNSLKDLVKACFLINCSRMSEIYERITRIMTGELAHIIL